MGKVYNSTIIRGIAAFTGTIRGCMRAGRTVTHIGNVRPHARPNTAPSAHYRIERKSALRSAWGSRSTARIGDFGAKNNGMDRACDSTANLPLFCMPGIRVFCYHGIMELLSMRQTISN